VDFTDGPLRADITIGPLVVESIRKVTKISSELHLMITDPEKYAPEFIEASGIKRDNIDFVLRAVPR
jgi:ribulose-phosphate 3-epimerase